MQTFYEWQWLNERGSAKQKYEIGITNSALFSFGGLWNSWYDKNTNSYKKTYTIVTTKALGIMEQIHNSKKRMPIILSKESERHWLLGDSVEGFKKIDVELFANKITLDNSDNSQFSIFD